jgi:hypothetical protein
MAVPDDNFPWVYTTDNISRSRVQINNEMIFRSSLSPCYLILIHVFLTCSLRSRTETPIHWGKWSMYGANNNKLNWFIFLSVSVFIESICTFTIQI